jgi:hypothetical protein
MNHSHLGVRGRLSVVHPHNPGASGIGQKSAHNYGAASPVRYLMYAKHLVWIVVLGVYDFVNVFL